MNSKSLIESVELAKIVRKLIPKKKSILSEKGKNQESVLFREIAESNSIRSDDEIIEAHGFSRRRYQQILSEINGWLFNRLVDLELPAEKFSDYARRLFALDRGHANLRILARLGGAFSANEEAKALFEEAKALEEWHLAISLLSPLLTWTSLSGDKEAYGQWISEQPRLLALESALADANEVSERAIMVFAKSSAEHPELLKIIQPAIERLTPVARKLGTFRLNEALLLLRKKAQQVTMDYDEALAICEEMDALLVQYPLFANRSRKSRNATSKLMCHVQQRKYEDAGRVAESALDLFNEGDQNWHSFQEWRFVLFMHTKQFSNGYEIVRQVMSRPSFSAQTQATRDVWNLFLRYAEYFMDMPVSGVTFHKNEKAGELHRRIMEKFPSFKGDFAGREMAAIVLEILIVLKHRQSDLFSRTESLQKYKVRHLQPGIETQSSIFIDLVQLLELYDSDRSKMAEVAAPMVKRMLAIKTIDPVQSQQVMPYEMLWAEMVKQWETAEPL